MALTPCHQLVKDLAEVIDARMLGRQVSSSSAKGRSATFTEMPIRELIAYYNQKRAACADALADTSLIAIAPLDQPTGTRGAPARFLGRSWV